MRDYLKNIYKTISFSYTSHTPMAVIQMALHLILFPCFNLTFLYFQFPGDPPGAQGKFNKAHRRTRTVVERAFGVLKKRFPALGTVLRVRDMALSSKLVECGCILHNLTIHFGLSEDDLDIEDNPQAQDGEDPAQERQQEQGRRCVDREKRRKELLEFFKTPAETR